MLVLGTGWRSKKSFIAASPRYLATYRFGTGDARIGLSRVGDLKAGASSIAD